MRHNCYLYFRSCCESVFVLLLFIDKYVVQSYMKNPFDQVFRRPWVIKCKPEFRYSLLLAILSQRAD